MINEFNISTTCTFYQSSFPPLYSYDRKVWRRITCKVSPAAAGLLRPPRSKVLTITNKLHYWSQNEYPNFQPTLTKITFCNYAAHLAYNFFLPRDKQRIVSAGPICLQATPTDRSLVSRQAGLWEKPRNPAGLLFPKQINRNLDFEGYICRDPPIFYWISYFFYF